MEVDFYPFYIPISQPMFASIIAGASNHFFLIALLAPWTSVPICKATSQELISDPAKLIKLVKSEDSPKSKHFWRIFNNQGSIQLQINNTSD